jgi:glycosyltransferase involved in cell wall biosynthesis
MKREAAAPDLSAVVCTRDRPSAAVICDSGRGAARARNMGWRRAHAVWIVFVDDDCVPQPGWLHELRGR